MCVKAQKSIKTQKITQLTMFFINFQTFSVNESQLSILIFITFTLMSNL